MEQHDREELAEVNAARKGFYEFLASMYKLELTDEQIETLAKQDLPADNTTPEDHLSFEFQFMAKLIERASAALDAGDAARSAELCAKQRTFFDEHLVNWVPRLCADVRAYAQTAFYRGVADITEGFLQLEDQMIGQSAQAA